ncbi:hypothetical protein Tco_0975652 [Tanacetum coccineum]|uniref:Uncharacterized protein n=1 Tax=Tanacetum coccineum TaxID=301880 RepID=A0ABQ5EF07_9ASTR
MDNSFTLGSIEEADNVKILQSCNGLLLCREIPHGLHRGRNFLLSFGGSIGSDDPMLVLIDILGMLCMEGGLSESRGCLLLLCRDDIGSREFTIYEMMKGCYVWMVGKYNLISKTINQIFDIGSNQIDDDDDDDDFEFFPLYIIPDLTQENPLWITPLVPLRKLIMLGSCSLAMVCFFVLVGHGLFFIRSVVLRMAFDPRKSFDYKVMQARHTSCDIEIQIYSSKTGNWSLCRDRFNYFSCDHFDSAIYWNDAFHWLETENGQLKDYKLNIKDHDYPIMITKEIPYGFHKGRNFLESFGGSSDDPILMLIKIPQMLC